VVHAVDVATMAGLAVYPRTYSSQPTVAGVSTFRNECLVGRHTATSRWHRALPCHVRHSATEIQSDYPKD